MKTLKLIAVWISGMLIALTFNSCLDDDGYSLNEFRISVATVESQGGGSHYFRLDNGETLWPSAGYYLGHNFDDGQRTLLNYTLLSDSIKGFSHYIKVNRVDAILTKSLAENKGLQNDSIYGTDPIKVKDLWIGNGYLNLVFGYNYGGQATHFVNLLQAEEEDPYTVEFRHNAYNDSPQIGMDGIVCFDLSTLPDTKGETVQLVFRVNTFDGEKEIELDYNSSRQTKEKSYVFPSDFNPEMLERLN
ncbi:NigD-like protein [Parabacteroides sp. PF5-9]|uniref:NigD-like protein n=1 Tax=Parabacteroides sp. PF5-9 TaxID=1742404 RepID=UPI0024740F7E|nr:NigD-like protein [Parabacteroides sp. PF5-9]MDH6356209.1 hypothetical protein [Parabacteroides sp. PF5-9]